MSNKKAWNLVDLEKKVENASDSYENCKNEKKVEGLFNEFIKAYDNLIKN